MKILITEPCTQSWETMQPDGCGRFCNSCQKTVIDFTGKTDKEIAHMLSSSASVCGRFSDSQLNRSLKPTQTSMRRIYTALGALVLLLSNTKSTSAQQKKRVEKVLYLNSSSIHEMVATDTTNTKLKSVLTTQATAALDTLQTLDSNLAGTVGGVSVKRSYFERLVFKIKRLFK